MTGHIFISYGRPDREYVQRLAGYLAGRGLPTWYDYDIETGESFWPRIQQALDECVAFVPVLTLSSVTRSGVIKEITYAIAAGKTILPLRIAPCTVPLPFADLQLEDTAGQLPSDRFVARLNQLLDGTGRLIAPHAMPAHRPQRSLPTPQRSLPTLMRTLVAQPFGMLSVAYSPKGTYLATANWSGVARIWRTETGAVVHTLKLSTLRRLLYGMTSVAYSPDGTEVATVSSDKAVRIWSPETAAHLLTLTGHADRVQSVAYSPDGTHLATASSDKTIRIWRADNGTHLHTLTGHTRAVQSVAYSPDGTHLATASFDRTVRIWWVGGAGRLTPWLDFR